MATGSPRGEITSAGSRQARVRVAAFVIGRLVPLVFRRDVERRTGVDRRGVAAGLIIERVGTRLHARCARRTVHQPVGYPRRERTFPRTVLQPYRSPRNHKTQKVTNRARAGTNRDNLGTNTPQAGTNQRRERVRQRAGGGPCWAQETRSIRRGDALGGPRIDTISRMSESCSRPDRSHHGRLTCPHEWNQCLSPG